MVLCKGLGRGAVAWDVSWSHVFAASASMTGHLRGLDIVQFEPGPRPQRYISSPIVVIRLTSLVLVRLLGGTKSDGTAFSKQV